MFDETPAVEARNIRFILMTMVVVVVINVVSSIFALGLPAAIFSTVVLGGLLFQHAFRHGDKRLLAWLIVGYGAGFTELAADWWLVTQTQSLVYPAGEPQIVVSPMYMPFAWAHVLAQLGMLAHWLGKRFAFPLATLLTALVAGINIPLYEHLAKGAQWWFYQDTPMVFGAPYYIIVGEFLLALPFIWIDRNLDRSSRSRQLLYGIGVGLGIFIAYWISWQLVGPCEGALIPIPCK